MSTSLVKINIYIILLCLCLIKCQDIEQSDLHAEYVQQSLTKMEASSYCQLAGSRRKDLVENVTFNVTKLQPGLVWFGASPRYTSWLAFHGCQGVMRSHIVKSVAGANNQLRTCEDYCTDNKYFALRGSYCFCLSVLSAKIPSTLLKLSACRGNTADICGEELSLFDPNTTLIDAFIYSKEYLPTATTGACLTSTKRGQTYTYATADCNTNMFFVCRHSYYNQYGYNDVNFYVGNSEKMATWRSAMEKCYSDYSYSSLSDRYDLADTNSNAFIPQRRSMWVGVFRREYYVWNQGITETENCVAANMSTDGSFEPVVVSCDIKLPFMCEVMQHTAKSVEAVSNNLVAGATGASVVILLMFGTAVILAVYIVRRKHGIRTHCKLEGEQEPEVEQDSVPEELNLPEVPPRQRRVSFHLTEEQYAKALANRESNEYNILHEGIKIFKDVSGDIYDHVQNNDNGDIYDHCNVEEKGDNRPKQYDSSQYDHIDRTDANIYDTTIIEDKVIRNEKYDSTDLPIESDVEGDRTVLIQEAVDDFAFLENTNEGLWQFKV